MRCGFCDSTDHESRECETVDVIQASERTAELPDLADVEAVQTWLEEGP